MTRRRRSKKWISWLIILLLLVAAGVVCYLVWDNYFNDKKQGNSEAGISQEEKKEEQKDDNPKEEKKEEEQAVKKEEVVQYDGDNPNNASSLTGAITYAAASGDNLMIRVNIDQYLSGGTCVLALVRDGATIYNSEAAIIDVASTSTCEGFNVPVATIGNGNFAISIKVSSGDKVGEITGEVRL